MIFPDLIYVFFCGNFKFDNRRSRNCFSLFACLVGRREEGEEQEEGEHELAVHLVQDSHAVGAGGEAGAAPPAYKRYAAPVEEDEYK